MKKYIVLKDTMQLSFTLPDNFHIESFFMDEKSSKIYFGGNKNYWILDLSQDSLEVNFSVETAENNIISIIVDGKLYYTDYTSLYIKDIVTHKMIDSINIGKDFKFHIINELIIYSNTNNVWLVLADMDGGEATDERYYVYNEISKKYSLSANNDSLKKMLDDNYYGVRYYDLSNQYTFWGELVFDSNFNLFSKVNIFDVNIHGLVFTNRKIMQLIVKSRLDRKANEKELNYVLIPVIPNPFREKAMYEIYENVKLTTSDLEQFDAFDLRILRNMIYAKHNYVFKDKFLQAYFNLYGFYGGDKDKNRLLDVNHLLTPEDKKNLELIQQVSKN
jgi:hypothetical protein